ncbi:hypothetical protein ABZ865_33255 [Streptomyces sp. NPDC047085]|uniref:hypothetical protein n=1 Tax=Streptomyces sp. NPDC047085 TaxID=3155140 RepID=UPI0033F1B265
MSEQQMSDREMWASLAGIAGIIALWVSFFLGMPLWLTLPAVLVLVVSIPVVWIEQKKRGHR